VLDDVLPLLRCPHCGAELASASGAVRCGAGHSFDVARQGYLNLLPGDARTGTADTAAMVEARERFLAAGHYAPIAAALATACEQAVAGEGCVVDVGAGTGHYLATALDRLAGGRVGLALDISKHALRRAARAHPGIGAVGCDAWQPLPVRDGVATLALSVFAPRDPDELARILAPSGALVVVTPTRRHLAELVPAVGMLTVQERKRERLEGKLGGAFASEAETEVETELLLSHDDLAALVAMGPSARHLDGPQVTDRVAALPEPFGVTLSVRLATYRRRA
jgi:23S rRNA (guanine745-N1)-methyltransferase